MFSADDFQFIVEGVNSGGICRAPRGLVTVGIFLLWGAAMASLAAATLICQGTVLDRIWALNPHAYSQLAPLRAKAGIPMLVVACALAAAGFGWFKRRRWAWWLTLVILVTQILGDFVNLFMGKLVEGVIGLVAAGALVFYISKAAVRGTF
jgi:hypothetical protein